MLILNISSSYEKIYGVLHHFRENWTPYTNIEVEHSYFIPQMWTCLSNLCVLSIICFNFNTERQIWHFELTFIENLLLVCNKSYPPKLLLQLENDNFKYLGYVPTWGMPWPRLHAQIDMPWPWLCAHSELSCHASQGKIYTLFHILLLQFFKIDDPLAIKSTNHTVP